MSFLQLGFRPFYAVASLFAIIAMIVWLSAFAGFAGTGTYLGGVLWHSHEMLFGFSVAVIAGFLLTAVRNWTGQATPSGAWLAALVGLWIAARVLIVTGPAAIAAIVDVLFLPTLAFAIAIPILHSSNLRNYKILWILAGLAVLNAAFHSSSLGYVDARLARVSLFAGIDLVIILLAIVAGRVIPAFTRNAVADATSRNEKWVEVASFGALLMAVMMSVAAEFFLLPSILLMTVFVIAAAANAIRLALWEPGKTLRIPLLWMMPTAYSWLPFAFILRASAVANLVSASAWIHAVTAGAVSSLMLAMMMRSSLGHTGRPLVASKLDVAAFLLLQFAAVVRVVASLAGGEFYTHWLNVSGMLWILAFAVFAIRYLPMLAKARVPE